MNLTSFPEARIDQGLDQPLSESGPVIDLLSIGEALKLQDARPDQGSIDQEAE